MSRSLGTSGENGNENENGNGNGNECGFRLEIPRLWDRPLRLCSAHRFGVAQGPNGNENENENGTEASGQDFGTLGFDRVRRAHSESSATGPTYHY